MWGFLMARKIFVSYKYKDENVYSLKRTSEEFLSGRTTVRTYVDKLEKYFDKTSSAVYKGESDDEDLSLISDDAIWDKLKDRIYDSTVTIVLISPNMKELYRRDKSQWIPWEISYSLKETTRNDRTSHSNAILAVVLPDRSGNYNYFWGDRQCNYCSCIQFNLDVVFDILRNNMFNKKDKISKNCYCGITNYLGEHSYIKTVKWSEFIVDPQKYINIAIDIQNHIDEYEIVKEI
jgi:hypothetical protein